MQSFMDDKSNHSVGAKSNMTTPVRTDRFVEQANVAQLSNRGKDLPTDETFNE